MTNPLHLERFRPTLVFILVPRALHESNISVVRVPFTFHLTNTKFESGRYIVRLDKNLLRLTAENCAKGGDCGAITVANSTDSAAGTLVFVEFAGRYLLSKAFWPLGRNTYEQEQVRRGTDRAAPPNPYQNSFQPYPFLHAQSQPTTLEIPSG
jgi:hypothetical protein